MLCCLSPADTDESLNSLQYMRLLPAVINLVLCGDSQRPLAAPASEPPPAERHAGGPSPARQVHPVQPLRHPLQAAGSPRPAAADVEPPPPPPPPQQPGGWQTAGGYGAEMDVRWVPASCGPAGGYPASYGAYGHQQPRMSAHSRDPAEVQQLGPGAHRAGQHQRTSQLVAPSPAQHPAATPGHQMPATQLSQLVVNSNQQLMDQNQALMRQNQALMSPNQLGLSHSLHQSHQMGLNQPVSPLNNQSQPVLHHSGQPTLSVSHHQLLNQSFATLSPRQLSAPAAACHGAHHVPPASRHGHQSALVQPYQQAVPPAVRLAGLGYTASPPLTSLTELSCQRATLLHESALVDLYQRLHVLELHQLAAAQQAALVATQPPTARSEPEQTDRRDDQLFQ